MSSFGVLDEIELYPEDFMAEDLELIAEEVGWVIDSLETLYGEDFPGCDVMLYDMLALHKKAQDLRGAE